MALLLTGGLLAAESGEPYHVTAVRYWSLGNVTRIVVETDGQFNVRSDRLSNPDRIYFDLTGTRPALGHKPVTVIPVSDKFVEQIRVGQQEGDVTRVVLDLARAAEASTSRLENPDRLIIELRGPGDAVDAETAQREPVERRQFKLPPANATDRLSRQPKEAVLEPPSLGWFPSPSAPAVSAKLSSAVFRVNPAALLAKPAIPPPVIVPPPQPVAPPVTAAVPPTRPAARPDDTRPEVALPAKHNSYGGQSMIRVLGLKVGRIVLDPGHGGHDTGTIGPKGLREKDLVLDIAKRLGALIEDRLGSEVIYTRSDDTFIPLERRTEIANEAKADLFLSIHANSSPLRSAAGVETYYLNFTTSRTALEVAARENAGSEKTIYELQDLLEKIALKDKVEESREFATRIQKSMFALSEKADSRAKDRGVGGRHSWC